MVDGRRIIGLEVDLIGPSLPGDQARARQLLEFALHLAHPAGHGMDDFPRVVRASGVAKEESEHGLPGFSEQRVGDMVRVSIRRSMINPMQLATGIVIGGKVVVEGVPLPEGTVVTVLARDANETFEVPPELEAELLESMAQADRGETISADEVIERLRRIT